MSFAEYGLYFGLTLAFSTIFAIGGVGSAIALVPGFSMLGMALDLAKPLGLFVNTASTATASVMNFRQGLLDVRFSLPLAGALLVATPLGAWTSQFVARDIVVGLLTAFLISAAMLLVFSRRAPLVSYPRAWPLVLIGGGVGAISGMLGVGGGALMIPALIMLGHDAKKAARAVSFVIPFSSAGGFLTYLAYTEMDWPLLGVVAAAAILGGYFGQNIMQNRLGAEQVKKLIAVLLLALAFRMIWSLVA